MLMIKWDLSEKVRMSIFNMSQHQNIYLHTIYLLYRMMMTGVKPLLD